MQNDDNVVYVFGDSHCCIFVGAEGDFRAVVAGYDGASISGLNEQTSRLVYGKHIVELITQQPKTYYALLKLGQVDLEFIMYYKLHVKKEVFTFEEFCQLLINKYREFIGKLLEINKNIIIAAINLPSYFASVDIKNYICRTINDPTLVDISEGDFSLEQMTNKFKYFNELLSNLAREMNLRFFDTTPLFMDNDTKLLKIEYQDYGHHYKGYSDDTQSSAKFVTHTFFQSFFTELIKI